MLPIAIMRFFVALAGSIAVYSTSACTPAAPPPVRNSTHAATAKDIACSSCTEANAGVWKPVDAQLTAYNASDITAFLAVYSSSVEIRDLETGALLLQGREAMRARYQNMFTTAPPHADVTTRIVSGEYVIDHEFATSGPHHRKLQTAAIYRVREGKIDRVWFSPPQYAPGSAPVTALVGATVVRPSMSGAPNMIQDSVVLLQDGKISAVGSAAATKVPPGAKIIDVHGKWITAGFIDSHIHFFQSGGIYTRPDSFDLRSKVPYAEEVKRIRARLPGTFRRWLASGVTGLADDGGPFWNFDVRDAAVSSRMAPRVKVAGPLLSTSDIAPVHRMDLDDPPIIPVKTPEDARALARRELERSPDFVKVWFVQQNGDDLAAQEAVTRAAADEAHAKGVRLMVHATSLDVAKAALRAGADILVHSVDDKPVDDEFISLAKARHVVYIPTLYVGTGYLTAYTATWTPTDVEKRLADPDVLKDLADIASMKPEELPLASPERLEKYRARAKSRYEFSSQNLIRLRDAGITIALGTDAGNVGTVHGPSVFREMDLMVKAGLTPSQVLHAATVGGAFVLGMQDELGVEPGRKADLVVLDKDPTAAVPTGTEIVWVISRGTVYSQQELLEAK